MIDGYQMELRTTSNGVAELLINGRAVAEIVVAHETPDHVSIDLLAPDHGDLYRALAWHPGTQPNGRKYAASRTDLVQPNKDDRPVMMLTAVVDLAKERRNT